MLAVIAIFRWQSHDEKLNKEIQNAINYVSLLVVEVKNSHKWDLNEAVDFLTAQIISLKNKSNTTDELSDKVVDLQLGVLERSKNTIIRLGGLTREIRKYFNYPFSLLSQR
jgi:transcription termination factor NusB